MRRKASLALAALLLLAVPLAAPAGAAPPVSAEAPTRVDRVFASWTDAGLPPAFRLERGERYVQWTHGDAWTRTLRAEDDGRVVVSVRRQARAQASHTDGPLHPCRDAKRESFAGPPRNGMRWRLYQGEVPSNLNRSRVASEIKIAFSNWEREIGCGRPDRTRLDFVFAGTTSRAPDFYRRDGQNRVGFTNFRRAGSSAPPGAEPIPCGAVGVTSAFIRNGRVVEWDLGLNTDVGVSVLGLLCVGGGQARWGIGRSDAFDVRNVMVHEVGHTLALADIYEDRHSKLTMYGFVWEGDTEKRTLARGEALWVESRYPR